MPITPGVDPPRRAAAAWPNSWKPAESTVTMKTASSRPGWWNASCVAEARPLSSSSHQQSQKNAAVMATTSTGWNRRANGAVSRSVFAGSVIDTR